MNPWNPVLAKVQKLRDVVDALPSIREATVTSTFPVAVRFDTDEASVDAYASIAPRLSIGDRVLTVRLARYLWVLGRRGGNPELQGAESITVGPGEVGSVTILFPVGLFKVAPLVFTELRTATPQDSRSSTNIPTTAGVTIYVYNNAVSTLTRTVSWLAKQGG